MIQHLYTSAQNIAVDVLRLDLHHELASGNKWFKLLPNLSAARRQGKERVISFGGAYSNHLHALAAVGHAEGIETIACVRADADAELSPTLLDAARWGMALHFLSRSDYRRRHDAEFIAELAAQYPNSYVIPEGGANVLGADGCGAIVDLLPDSGRDYTAVVLACGTGTSLAGVASKIAAGVSVIGIPVLKAEKFMAKDICALLAELGGDRNNWCLDHRFHGGAYARLPSHMAAYMQQFEQQYGVLLDPVYTAKAAYALQYMVDHNEFDKGSKVLFIHTGGLQGRRGFGL